MPFSDVVTLATMPQDPVLHRLYKDLSAQSAAKARVKRKVLQRIKSESLSSLSAPEPSEAIKNAIWERVYARITSPTAATTLERLREFLTPSPQLRSQVQHQVALRLAPVSVQAVWPQRMLKLTAAFALVAIAVRMSPALFVATPTVADSAVTLLPTRGEVSISVGGMWQPVQGELVLEPGMMLRTHNGEASILFHDDGVVRLDANTTVKLHDTAVRSTPEQLVAEPTLTLFTGRLWVQGLVPSNVQGLTVETSFGNVTVHEGSVSIAEDDVVDVLVFNRRSIASHDGNEIVLVAGERTQMWEGNVPLVKKVANTQYESEWPAQNLARDAVHRREIAQLQQERRAAMAGILPTSPLYPVKRAAETMDVLLTFGQEARTQKRIDQAQRRLDEAAALFAGNNNQDAERHLAEYRDMLQNLAKETEGSSLTDYLLQQSLSETSAQVAAVQPEDDGYLIKLAVLEASTELDSARSSLELEAVLLMDALASADRLVDEGEFAQARSDWISLEPSLAILEDEQLPVDVQKEVLALVQRFSAKVQNYDQEFAGIDASFTEQLTAYNPVEPAEEQVVIMSEDELQVLVQSIRSRIFVYHMRQSRLNQLVAELKALGGHPEEGRILRRLYTILPGGPENFPDRIEKEITRLRWEKASELL